MTLLGRTKLTSVDLTGVVLSKKDLQKLAPYALINVGPDRSITMRKNTGRIRLIMNGNEQMRFENAIVDRLGIGKRASK